MNRTAYNFELTIGDWSGDGHSQTQQFIIRFSCVSGDTDGAMNEIREAAERARKIRPDLNPENFCADYEDRTMPQDVRTAYESLGVVFMDERTYTTATDMVACVIAFLKIGDPDLAPELVDIPSIPLGGRKGGVFGSIGYGVFSP